MANFLTANGRRSGADGSSRRYDRGGTVALSKRSSLDALVPAGCMAAGFSELLSDLRRSAARALRYDGDHGRRSDRPHHCVPRRGRGSAFPSRCHDSVRRRPARFQRRYSAHRPRRLGRTATDEKDGRCSRADGVRLPPQFDRNEPPRRRPIPALHAWDRAESLQRHARPSATATCSISSTNTQFPAENTRRLFFTPP